MKVSKTYFSGSDGTKLYYEAFVPEKVEATLIIVHGLSEYIASYAGFRDFLTAPTLRCTVLMQGVTETLRVSVPMSTAGPNIRKTCTVLSL